MLSQNQQGFATSIRAGSGTIWFCRWLIYQEFVLKGTGVKSFFQEFSPGGDQN